MPTAALTDKRDIKVASKAAFKFDDDSTCEEITAHYFFGKDYLDKIILSFLNVDGGTCIDGIKEGQLKRADGPKQTKVVGTGDTVVAEFKIDLDLPNIVEEGEIWTSAGDSSGEILVCTRADVIEVLETGATGATEVTLDDGSKGVSISFTETIYKVLLTYAEDLENFVVIAVKWLLRMKRKQLTLPMVCLHASAILW